MSRQFPNGYFSYFLILIVASVLCFINLGGHPVYILDEAKNAEAAREMFVNHNWIVPAFNGELRTDKPVLHYWLMILSYKIFGVSAFSARFFSAVFGILTLVSTFHFTKKFLGIRIAAVSMLVLFSSIFFIQEFHLAVPDPYLIFFVSFGLFNFYDFYKRICHSEYSSDNYRNEMKNLKPAQSKDSPFLGMTNWFLFYASVGLGILAKGPVALVLPGLIILIFLIFKKDFKWKTILKLNPFLGLILTFLIAFPWFYLVHQKTNGEFTKGFFLEHNFQRFSGEMEGHGGLPFVTWAFVILGLLPFSFFIIQGFLRGWKARKTNDFILFSFVVSAVFILFFSFSGTKLPNYPMPAYPFIAVLIGFYLNEILENKIKIKGFKISLWILFVIAILLPIGGFIALGFVEKQLFEARFYSFILILLPVGIGISLYFLNRNRIKESIIAISLGGMLTTIGLFGWVYPKLVNLSPVVVSKSIILQHPNSIVYKGYDPAFLFNFQRTFSIEDNKENILEFLKNNPNGIVITKEKFYNSDWKNESTEILVKQKALFENYTIVIFKINE
jgi:4-amino-4-deoxy-L-arabinose transferase-like glycosyltransferase